MNVIANLMVPTNLATSGLLKLKVFWNKGNGVIISVHDVTNKFLSRESNSIAAVFKFGTSSISTWWDIITSIL